MRIIAGAKRGMKLLSPPRFCLRQKTRGSRPITDRVKESLFNVLWNYGFPEDKIAADLFCGVGSLGLEALSRGAEFVTFVEKDPKITAILEKNIEKAGFAGESKVIKADAFKIGAPVDVQKYDLIFVDPPYSATRLDSASSRGRTRETIPHLFVSSSQRQKRKSGRISPKVISDLTDEANRCGTPLSELLVLLSEQSSPNGIVVVRTEKRTRDEGRETKDEGRINQLPFNQSPITNRCRFEVIERRQWGTMAVTILRKKKIVNE
jgi:16S rRNA (guanine(966)-N(2))-methyltransferase RsmD